jgi:hypothetical protein
LVCQQSSGKNSDKLALPKAWLDPYDSFMEEIGKRLLHQRVRNRVIELLDITCSFTEIAKFGAFWVINMAYDWLPLDYRDAPNVFDEKEKHAVEEFLRLMEKAAVTTTHDTWDIRWFENSLEWRELSAYAKKSLHVFINRGLFSEDVENISLS